MRACSFILHLGSVLLVLAGTSAASAQDSKENADFKLAINLYNDGLYDLAAEQLKQFISTYSATPQGIDARFYLGLTQLKLKKYDDARLTFQSFALTYQDNPRASEAWWNVGESYAALGSNREAALAFERVKVFHPQSKSAPDALLEASRYFMLAGSREDARRVLREILQEYPTSGAAPGARTHLARIYFQEGNYEQAQTELKHVIEGDPSGESRAGALLLLGNIAQATGRTESAQASYTEIINKYAKTSAVRGAYLNIGKLSAAAGKNAEALGWFRKAMAGGAAPDSAMEAEALSATGDAQAALGQYAEAASSYEQCLRAMPAGDGATEVLWKLASSAARAKDFARSNDACTRILVSGAPAPVKGRARLQMARNAEGQKNFAAALLQLEAYTDAAPEDPATPGLLLREAKLCETGLGDTRKAAALYEQIASRYTSAPAADDALAGAGRAYEQMKEYDRALQAYRDLTGRYPASDFRAEAETRIRRIETFEAKDKDAGLEKLALLVGDVVAEKDRAGIAFRLGEIYFSDLKNYQAAAAQFDNAIQAGLGGARAAEALYRKAQSLEYLSWKDRDEAPRAVEAYRSYIALGPAAADSNAALLALFRLQSPTLAGAEDAAAAIMAAHPAFSGIDEMELALGRLYQQADSLPAAAGAYAVASAAAHDSTVAEESAYGSLEILFIVGPQDSAFMAGNAFLERYPWSPHAAVLLSRLGDAAMAAGHPHEAAACYRRLTGEFAYAGAAEGADEKLGAALASAGDTAEAVALYREIAERATDDPLGDGKPAPDVLLALGKLSWQEGKADEAKRDLVAVLAREQTGNLAGEACNALGMIYRAEGEREIATAYFRQAESAAPGTAVTRDIADLLFANGDYADAIKEYAQLAQEHQADTAGEYFQSQIIIATLRQGDLPGAEGLIAAFRMQHGDARDAIAQFDLEKGLALFRKNDFARAMNEFRSVADKSEDTPSGPTAMYWIGKTLEATEKNQEAIDALEALLKAHPDAPIISRVHFALGNLFYAAEKWDEAVKEYRLVTANPHADPDLLPPAMSNLISTYEAAGAFDGALTMTRKYLELYPNADDALDKKIKIGILYDRLGYYDQSVLQLQSLLDEAGSDLEAELRYYIAEANFHKGDYQQAILDFLKIPYLVSKKGKIDWTANALYMSGQSYEKMGRFDQALTMYQQIVDRSGIDPTFKSAARKEIDRVRSILKKNPG